MLAKVVDASVIAAWIFRESQASEAAAVLKGAEIYAPALLAYELTSIARRKIKDHPESKTSIEEALKTALATPIHWIEIDHPGVLTLALKADLSTYDACYLFLARSLGVPLVTFDKKLSSAAATGY